MLIDLGAQFLRRLDPETAHQAAMLALRAGLAPRAAPAPARLRARLCGLDLPSPIGLAAGFDKGAEACRTLLRAGFGFVEAGTVTPLPQPGNPRPRLFRLAEDEAVINRMGFNSAGLAPFVRNLAQGQGAGIIGANVGANKDSGDRAGDYVLGLRRVWPFASYVALNVSSPNTPGLRELQGQSALADMLGRIAKARDELAAEHGARPVLLKIAPDLEEREADEIVDVAISFGVSGLIVSNTTVARPAGLRSPHAGEKGGLSGRPLLAPSTALLRRIARRAAGRLGLVGVGGVWGAQDVFDKLAAGASAVQVYSVLAYAGPSWLGRAQAELAALLEARGFGSAADAVGSEL